jgi:hypothetical protein
MAASLRHREFSLFCTEKERQAAGLYNVQISYTRERERANTKQKRLHEKKRIS